MLPIRSGPKSPGEPLFQHPPQWIHEAGKWLFAPREARKRELVRLIDRLPAARKKGV
jgi:hypothetical protein